MAAKRRDELFERPKPRTAREQFETLQKKGFFGVWQGLVPETMNSTELAQELRKNAESRLNDD